MNPEQLKQAVENIQLSEEQKNRLVALCRQQSENEVEAKSMKRFNIRKLSVVAAAAVLCLGLSVVTMAGGAGWFKDIIGFNGAVVGTEYMQADDEIQLTVATEDDMLAITAIMAEKAPYTYCEYLSVGAYEICDDTGKVILRAEGSDKAPVKNFSAKLLVPVDELDEGSYRLNIESFVSEKKAEQPLSIYGSWTCEFVK